MPGVLPHSPPNSLIVAVPSARARTDARFRGCGRRTRAPSQEADVPTLPCVLSKPRSHSALLCSQGRVCGSFSPRRRAAAHCSPRVTDRSSVHARDEATGHQWSRARQKRGRSNNIAVVWSSFDTERGAVEAGGVSGQLCLYMCCNCAKRRARGLACWWTPALRAPLARTSIVPALRSHPTPRPRACQVVSRAARSATMPLNIPPPASKAVFVPLRIQFQVIRMIPIRLK